MTTAGGGKTAGGSSGTRSSGGALNALGISGGGGASHRGAVIVDPQIGQGPVTPASAAGTLRPEPHVPHEKCRTCGASGSIDGDGSLLTKVRYSENLTNPSAYGKTSFWPPLPWIGGRQRRSAGEKPASSLHSRPPVVTPRMSHWQRFQEYFVRYEDLGLSIDISRMEFDAGFFDRMSPLTDRAFADMRDLEAGKIANPDENRMVGHYWLRRPELAPKELQGEIARDIADSKAFGEAVRSGAVTAPSGEKFRHLLIIGIGGSALGPQFLTEALVDRATAPLTTHFFDNTDPDGIQRVLSELGHDLSRTLTVVISKSGGTPETRNGMLEARAAYERAGLDFSKHAVAVTGTKANHIDSKLEKYATDHQWLRIFPMTDWVGGRTSVMSTVGLVPHSIQGVDVDALLAGAAAVDEKTRTLPARQNISMLLALMWHVAGQGRGAKDMVILPYKDRLSLFSKYLQQLVMESLGKETDLDGRVVNQGIAVYGNKGSTDQHAYVQQLRDGVNNFFATFIEVREAASAPQLEVEPGITSGDFLQGFLRGTRTALHASGRQSITLSVPKVDAFYVGALIAVFERAVSFYASLVNINAYHQPGVEAGKKAAATFLTLLQSVRGQLSSAPQTADAIAQAAKLDAEDAFHALNHLAANGAAQRNVGASAADDTFSAA